MRATKAPAVQFCFLSGFETDEAATSEFVREKLIPKIPVDAKLISLDGFDGVGKTTIAKELGSHLSRDVVHIDDFLNRDQGFFLEALRFDAIQSALSAAPHVVVEGCLVSDVLERVGLIADFQIYVARTSNMHHYPDAERFDEHDILFSERSVEEIIADEQRHIENFAKMPPEFGGGEVGTIPKLWLELLQYHRRRMPHETADLMLKMARFN